MKIHLGCGAAILKGWDNLDLEPPVGGIKCDLSRGLPMYQPNSVDLAYSEHFIEHLTEFEGHKLFQEVLRVLKPNGIFRISTPSLITLAKNYLQGDIKYYAPVSWLPQTPCQMMNQGMRMWGHQFLYDYLHLSRMLLDVGFIGVSREDHGVSINPYLSGLECRPDLGDLIVEAVK